MTWSQNVFTISLFSKCTSHKLTNLGLLAWVREFEFDSAWFSAHFALFYVNASEWPINVFPIVSLKILVVESHADVGNLLVPQNRASLFHRDDQSDFHLMLKESLMCAVKFYHKILWALGRPFQDCAFLDIGVQGKIKKEQRYFLNINLFACRTSRHLLLLINLPMIINILLRSKYQTLHFSF